MKILVCDDEAAIRNLFASALEEMEFKTAEASSGYDAMNILKSEQIDFVVSDYLMAEGDGGSLSHFCADRKIPCVIVSGHDPAEIQSYLPKGTIAVRKADFVTFFRGPIVELIRLTRQAACNRCRTEAKEAKSCEVEC